MVSIKTCNQNYISKSYVWIFGGFKCSTQAEVYGTEVQDESF